MSVLKQSNLCAQSNLKSYSTMKRTLGLILLTIIFQQIVLTQATDISPNSIEPNPRKVELDCYRLKFIMKSLILRIRRLEADAFHMSKMPFELAEIESWCGNDLQSDMIKRSFDEIDRTGFRGFSKKNFDEIDKVGFRGFMGRK